MSLRSPNAGGNFSGDYYEVLGVPRGSDERDVKRAYFRLVRKFSPESAPEEFKKIREAYEVLGNPVSRKDYDSLTQFGEDINHHLRAGQAAMERGDFKTAQQEFKRVLVLNKDLAFARDFLGMAFLSSGQARDALTQFEQLCGAQPDNAVYFLHKGYAHAALRQLQQAVTAYQRALEIEPTDSRARIALADVYNDLQHFDGALEQLDRAIADRRGEGGGGTFQDFVFLMRKVQVQLLRNRPELAERQLDEIEALLPDSGDKVATRKYVATRIAALAAQLFQMRRSADGNRMLARAHRLDERKGYGFQFPARVTLPIRELPAASREALAAMKRSWSATKIARRALTGPVFLLLGAIAASLIGFATVSDADQIWHGGTRLFMGLFIGGLPLLGLLAVRRVRRVTASPYGRFTEVHPLYLLQVELDQVVVHPLVNLYDVALTHHLQNGAYQSTSVRMDFGGVPHHVTIRGQQAAVEWAQNLIDTRQRTLALLGEGLLDGDQELDLIPPEQLAAVIPRQPSRQRRERALAYGGAAAFGALLFFGGAVPWNRANAEGAAWRNSSGDGASPSSYRAYLEEFPDGANAETARRAIDAFYDHARAQFAERKDSHVFPPVPAAGSVALAATIESLRRAGASEIGLHAQGASDLAGLASASPQVRASAQGALGGANARSREEALLAAWRQAMAGGFSGPIGVAAETPETPTPVSIDLRYRMSPSVRAVKSRPGASSLRELALLSEFDLVVRDGDRDLYHFQRTFTKGARAPRDASRSDADEGATWAALAQEAFDDFGAQAAADFGLAWTAPAHDDAAGDVQLSDEDARRNRTFLEQVAEEARQRGASDE